MLKDRLERIKAASAAKVPPETWATMQKAKADLAASGILQHTIKTGDKFPDFSLTDATGQQINFADLRAQGPVLITLYRGVW